MVHKRTLPKIFNPLLEDTYTPPHGILVERRRLGQTDLTAKPGQQGVTNATKAKNLGIFDYAHLRVPLPKDLTGSGIFGPQKNGAYPESYFLMRRSSDGYISATGMFKAAFPWASIDEEQDERKHHKELANAGQEEIAGNVWIDAENALKLAEEYKMRAWIVALLDEEDIERGTEKKQDIATPPKFHMDDKDKFVFQNGGVPMGKRSLRSSSPSKTRIATPSKRIASPRKSQAKRKGRAESAATSNTSSALQNQLENGFQASIDGSVDGDVAKTNGENVRVEVDETIETTGDTEVVHTNILVEMPADHPDLRLPEDTGEMVKVAREIVGIAKNSEGSSGSGISRKRKIDEIEEDEDEDEEEATSTAVQPMKRAKLENAIRTERVRNRATLAVAATVAIGAILPYFL